MRYRSRTTHFYRGEPAPENEIVGVLYGCSTLDSAALRRSEEHSDFKWVTVDEASAVLPPGHRLIQLIDWADAIRRLTPHDLRQLHQARDFEE